MVRYLDSEIVEMVDKSYIMNLAKALLMRRMRKVVRERVAGQGRDEGTNGM